MCSLEEYEGRFSLSLLSAYPAERVVPVGAEEERNAVIADMLAREAQSAHKMLANGSLAAVLERNNLIEERAVARLADVCADREYRPEMVVRASAALGSARAREVNASCVTRAELNAEQQLDALLALLGAGIHCAENILHAVAETEAAGHSALVVRDKARPVEGHTALIGVPDVEHGIHLGAGGGDLLTREYSIPLCAHCGEITLGCCEVGRLICECGNGTDARRIAYCIDKLLLLTGPKSYLAADAAANVVGIDIGRCEAAALNTDRIGLVAIIAEKRAALTLIADCGQRRGHKGILTLIVRELVRRIIDYRAVLPVAVAEVSRPLLKHVGHCVIERKLHVAEGAERSRTVGIIADRCFPHLVIFAVGDEVGNARGNIRILALDGGIAHAVTALILLHIAHNGLPGCRPVLAALHVAEIEVMTGAVHRNAAVIVLCNTVAAGIAVKNESARVV